MIMTLNERPLPLYHLSTCQYWQFKDECHSLLHKRNLSLTTIYIWNDKKFKKKGKRNRKCKRATLLVLTVNKGLAWGHCLLKKGLESIHVYGKWIFLCFLILSGISGFVFTQAREDNLSGYSINTKAGFGPYGHILQTADGTQHSCS